MRTDMTAGKPMKILLDFTIPVFIGNVFQQFYNMVHGSWDIISALGHWQRLVPQGLSCF